MHEMSNNTKLVLRAILDSGCMTRSDLRELLPTAAVDSALGTLQTHKLIEGTVSDRKASYTATPKGIRLHRKRGGEVAGPRMPVSEAPYTGQKPIAYRPGSMDAYSKPSRSGETFTPYTRPLILASKVQSTRFP